MLTITFLNQVGTTAVSSHKTNDFMINFYPQPRFHTGLLAFFFKYLVKRVRAGCKSGNIVFLVLLGPLNTTSLVACFLQEMPAGVHMLPDYFGILSNKSG